MRCAPWIALLPCLVAAGAQAADNRPVLAVFNVEGKRIKLDKDLADALADHAAALLTEAGSFQVVPRDQLKERLTQQKSASYQACYDQSCQLEIGKELAAEKSLAIQVIKIGSYCTVNATLYDLKKSTTEKAATSEKANCKDEDALLTALERAIHKLALPSGAPPPEPVKARGPDVAALPRPVPEPPRPAPAAPAAPGVEMIDVPGGFAWRGCNKGIDPDCPEDEQPGKLLELKAFAIDKTEVTVAQYMQCVSAGRCSQPDPAAMQAASSYGFGYAYSFGGAAGGSGGVGLNFQQPGRENHPMNGVTWRQAREYCAYAGKRLPTEAEWERAARGGTSTRYPWGGDWEPGIANAIETAGRDQFGETAPVGTFPANPWGLLDMIGNAAEWVADRYHRNYWEAPGDGRAWNQLTGEWADEQRVVRGGSCAAPASRLRVSFREQRSPYVAARTVGFRCAAEK